MLTARITALERRRPRVSSAPIRAFDYEAYRVAFEAAVAERGVEAVEREIMEACAAAIGETPPRPVPRPRVSGICDSEGLRLGERSPQ